MIEFLGGWPLTLASCVFWLWYGWNVGRWNWSACRCGREKLPWFGREHEKEWLMWGYLVLVALIAVGQALLAETVWSIMFGLVSVYQFRSIHEHRKGKKSILGRLAGRVRVNHHGRLVIDRA